MSSPNNSIISDDEGENDQRNILENDYRSVEVHSENDNVGEIKENEDQEKTIVKPKQVVRNPRPKLDVLLLRGPRGISCLENYFKKLEYKGPGYEAEDLRIIMKTYEYWCHRLFPKYPFDECLARIEKLGTKKPMQTYLKKIRLGMEDLIESNPYISDNEEESEQVHEQSDVTQRTNTAFDRLTTRPVQSNEEIQLTDEQLEMIRINRQRANKLRLERLQKVQEKADCLISQSGLAGTTVQESLPSTSMEPL